MSIQIPRGRTDSTPEQIRTVLEEYQRGHPSAEISLYRQNGVSVRIKIVDPEFEGVSKSARHASAWGFLERLPDEIQSDISMLVLLAPGQENQSLANIEFEDPSRSAIE